MGAILSLDISALLWDVFVLQGGDVMAGQAITLEKWAAEWFCIHVEGKLSPNTGGGRRNLIFNHIVPRLGAVALTDCSHLSA